jgi:WD40 repeat protein
MIRSSAVLVAALVALMVPAQASATYPGANGKIAYTSYGGGSGQIWTMSPDGSGKSALIPGEDPAWSADGTKLTYECLPGGGICTANADGSGTTAGFGECCGPNGSPTWSPDGALIVWQAGPFCSHGSCTTPEIWRSDADGSDHIFFRYGSEPDWSPDGARIAYTTPTQQVQSVASNNSSSDGGFDAGAGLNYSPSWSPDDDVAFVSDRDGNYEIYKMDKFGRNQTRLTNDPQQDIDPEWSPNSDKIAFTSNRDGNYDVYTMNPDGSGVTRLTNDPSYDCCSDWQPIRAQVPRPKGATPILVSLVPAAEPCSTPNAQHGPPLASGSCRPPVGSSLSATIGKKSRGFVRLDVPAANPGNGIDDADVKVSVSLTDVLRRSDLADLTQDLDMPLPVRITDYDNGGARITPATVKEFNYFDNPFRFRVPCAATSDTTIGAACSLQSSVEALVPPSLGQQFIQEGKRSIWQLERIALYDGGEDTFPSSFDDNTVLAVQGLFVP